MLSRRKLPINISPPEKPLFEHELTREIPNHKVIDYGNALVTPDGVVLVKGKVEEESLYSETHKSFFDDIYKAYYTMAGWLVKKDEKAYLLAYDAWSFGYFHWMTEFIPRLFKARHLLDKSTVLIPSVNNAIWNKRSAISSLYRQGTPIPESGYYQESLELFNIRFPHRHSLRKPLRAGKLFLSSHVAPSGNYDDEVMCALRDFYYEGYRIGVKEPWRMIYVSRSKAPRRHVRNERELTEHLRAQGFEMMTLENLSFREQIVLLSETKFLIGQHGAALSNLLFMRENTFVLELKAEGDSHNHCYFSLASAMSVNYLYQFCQSDKRSVQDADIEVDISLLNKNVKLVCNS